MKQSILLLTLLFVGNLQAHQSDVSTTMLVEKEPGTWMLYVNSSLNAFEYEVKTHFGENAFATPEEFQKLVLQHLKSTLSVRFNDNTEALLTKGGIKLGHETGAVFTLTNVPAGLQELHITNTAFTNIHRNKSILVFLKKDQEKVQVELNEANEHTANFDLRSGEVRSVVAAGFPGIPKTLVPIFLLGLLGLAGWEVLGLRLFKTR